ncbi:methionine ABC transporter ATP-binding protein [Neiella marina]|uniref:Methionine ABC transporter ATP-binding protein n=1 Tax=Neiella marina TaxID=508461 RepID=A0A8J2U7D0_9GAMM|nr:ABC transporter ATP-binding protein [Neiella marina]GGA83585.1 methionine ABC transporter ATP-binding protein [Neiella marina]
MQNVELTTDQAAISLTQLRFSYDGSNDVIHIPKWALESGQKCFVFGASGAGKSTLMNLMCGVLKPTTGDIEVFGQSLTSMSARQRDRFRAKHIGVVFQQFNLIPYLTVADNIRLAAWFAGKAERAEQDAFQQRMLELVAALQLKPEVLDRPSRELSVGQQQRVAIVRALINQPDLLIVDEPTSALDSYARDNFMKLLMAVCDEQNSTLLFVSHDLSLQSYFDVGVNLADINCAGGQ